MMLQPEEVKPKNFINFPIDERNGDSITDRSSASPSNIDELMDDEIVNQKTEKEEDRRFLYLQHQISKIMRHLKVEPCLCDNCSHVEQGQDSLRKMPNDASAMLSQLFPNASDQQIQTLLELSKNNQLPSQVTQSSAQLGSGYATHASNGGGKMTTISDKKCAVTTAPYTQRVTVVNSATTSPGPSSDGGSDEHENIEQPQQPTPTVPPNMFTQSMVDMLKMNANAANAAHSTGSPGFLRGRGRGRPKLIGDELDADLVDYMVQVKQNDCHGHLTASQALHIAKQYILERAPGLLEEHGGHVKLKLTWAMKLVSRIAERQKEIEYGLPAGTLSNMGRTLGTLPGNQFMADVVAQNLLSQHMMMVNQMNNTSNTTTTQVPIENRQPTGMMPIASTMKEENSLAPGQGDFFM